MKYASSITDTAHTSVTNAVIFRSICSFVTPDGTFGKDAALQMMDYENGFISWKPEYHDVMTHIMKRENVAAYSCKAAKLLDVLDRIVRGGSSSWIRSNMYGKVYIYSETIHGVVDYIVHALFCSYWRSFIQFV